ncbi:MAG TPA: GGDEF domain-containing protein [Longimicrobiales bacterium]|nr:GGDEF domain-containing protein [Longimicrobiales bacterium]
MKMPRLPLGALGVVAAWLAGVLLALAFDGLAMRIGVALCAVAAVAALLHAHAREAAGAATLALLALAPLHLAILATGALASPVVALAGVWAVAVAWTLPTVGAALAVAAAALLLGGLTAFVDVPHVGGLVGLGAALAAGGLLGAALRRATLRLRLGQRRLIAIEEEARRGMTGAAVGPGERVRLLEGALDSARAQMGAARVVLWQVEPDHNRVVPRLALPGPSPRPVNLSGTPLRWVWEERVPLRLEGRAGGGAAIPADGGACVVPVDDDTILAFEFDPGRLPPDTLSAADAGRYIGALLELQRSQGVADAARRRFDDLLGVLERLASSGAAEEWAAEVAETARILAGGSGALVASWDENGVGSVLALVGDDGGPRAGDPVGAIDSEIALAVRTRSVIVREDIRAGQSRLPVAVASERWFARPRSLASIPLDTTNGIIGMLCVWNADRPALEQPGLATLRTLAPYAALQLRQFAVQETLRERAERDALTGMPNRGAFDERLDVEIARYRRYRHPLSLIVIDVDHFKAVNDTWGHDAGDVVLRHIGRILVASIRETDHAARLGGEEFAVLLPETDLPQAVETAERIRVAVEKASVEHGRETLGVRISAGVATCPTVASDPASLIPSADAALYASKQGGRNRVTAATPSEDPSITSRK